MTDVVPAAIGLGLPLAIRRGSIWHWEPLSPAASQQIMVTGVEWDGEQWWVQAVKYPARPKDRRPYWNELDRFVEAAVLVRPASQAEAGEQRDAEDERAIAKALGVEA
jgi:hypothetical protein